MSPPGQTARDARAERRSAAGQSLPQPSAQPRMPSVAGSASSSPWAAIVDDTAAIIQASEAAAAQSKKLSSPWAALLADPEIAPDTSETPTAMQTSSGISTGAVPLSSARELRQIASPRQETEEEVDELEEEEGMIFSAGSSTRVSKAIMEDIGQPSSSLPPSSLPPSSAQDTAGRSITTLMNTPAVEFTSQFGVPQTPHDMLEILNTELLEVRDKLSEASDDLMRCRVGMERLGAFMERIIARLEELEAEKANK